MLVEQCSMPAGADSHLGVLCPCIANKGAVCPEAVPWLAGLRPQASRLALGRHGCRNPSGADPACTARSVEAVAPLLTQLRQMATACEQPLDDSLQQLGRGGGLWDIAQLAVARQRTLGTSERDKLGQALLCLDRAILQCSL